jgi:NAD(P)-dependent dehydrogenase (short-subunit alcohol dehydrogenase family)
MSPAASPEPSSDQPLRGLAALVTGGGSGIGLECARLLVRDGAAVTICGRSVERLADGQATLEADAGPDAVVQTIACEVTDESQVTAAVARATEPVSGLHLVVASAGTGGLGPLVTTSLDEWNRILDINLTGTFLTFKHAGAAVARSGGGSMVAISSIAGVATHRFMGPYAVSKAAIDMLVANLADELGTAGVRVNSVRPGLVETDLVEALMSDESTVSDYLDQMPIRRVGSTSDVAAYVRFILDPATSWLTGENLSIDGGHHLRRGPNFEPLARALFGDAVDGVVEPPGD